METERLKRIGKILLVSVGAYITSFFVVFGLSLALGAVAVSSNNRPMHNYIVGPLPLFCEGRFGPDDPHQEMPLYTGKEWPFVVYRPLVALYNHWEIPYIKKIDEEIEATQKTFIR